MESALRRVAAEGGAGTLAAAWEAAARPDDGDERMARDLDRLRAALPRDGVLAGCDGALARAPGGARMDRGATAPGPSGSALPSGPGGAAGRHPEGGFRRLARGAQPGAAARGHGPGTYQRRLRFRAPWRGCWCAAARRGAWWKAADAASRWLLGVLRGQRFAPLPGRGSRRTNSSSAAAPRRWRPGGNGWRRRRNSRAPSPWPASKWPASTTNRGTTGCSPPSAPAAGAGAGIPRLPGVPGPGRRAGGCRAGAAGLRRRLAVQGAGEPRRPAAGWAARRRHGAGRRHAGDGRDGAWRGLRAADRGGAPVRPTPPPAGGADLRRARAVPRLQRRRARDGGAFPLPGFGGGGGIARLPRFAFDPSAGPDWASRFSLDGNPQPGLPWPVHPLQWEDAAHRRQDETVAFTAVDFLACDRRAARHLAAVAREAWSEQLQPVPDVLAHAGRRGSRAGGVHGRRGRCALKGGGRRGAAERGPAVPGALAVVAGAWRHRQFARRACG